VQAALGCDVTFEVLKPLVHIMVCVMWLGLGYCAAKPKSVLVKSFTARSVTTEYTP